MLELRVHLFGPFQIVSTDREVAGSILRKAQELLALVLLAPQRNVRREQAAEVVWPDAGPEASRKAIRQALWQIHRVTDTGGPAGQRLVLTDGDLLRVNPDRPLWTDVAVFTEQARAAQLTQVEDLTDADLAAMDQASTLYRGPLLASCYEEWCLAERAQLEDLHITLLDKLSRGCERRGRLEAAICWAQKLLEIEPAHERSHRRLMRLYYLTDDRTRALRQFRRCRQVLANELGVRPQPRTEALAAEIGADNPPPPSTHSPPAVRPVAAAPGPPATLDSVRAEVAALRASVDAISHQLRNSPA
ncbi:BTAD domain-containing putative transcriptional regulator [Streptomyces sp. NPDC005727]|uniref:AfsR/SARP family transcriptional regulator n=1 Tax=Streptomyces sp. NPDC005727 TaxID=3157053 RepID=UPI00340446E6